jgi:hypothetical protein
MDMRTFEYIALTILICAAVIYGATKVAAAISGSIVNSAATIAGPGR